MKRLCVFAVEMIVAVSVFACSEPSTSDYPLSDHHAEMNSTALQLQNHLAEEAAVIRQHTIFPYHFLADSAELNSLGLRDLEVLTRHRARFPGPLNLRRGDASEELYARRMQTLLDHLIAAGLPQDGIQISDSLPGGDGLAADDVVLIQSGKSGSDDSGGVEIRTGSQGTGLQGGSYQ